MLDCLHKEKGSKIWEEWAKLKLENKTKAETVISYLPSLEKFLNFVLEEQNEEDSNLPLPDEVTVKGLGKVSRKLGAWHSTIRKEYMSENWKTVLNETCNQVKPSDIKDFNQTEPALQTKKLLEEAITRELDISEYCIVRDYLLTNLLLQNGQRPGVLEEVLCDDFNDAEADPATGIYNIFATQHKTSAAGPAQHTMTKSLHRHMQIFASHVRTIFHTNLGISHHNHHKKHDNPKLKRRKSTCISMVSVIMSLSYLPLSSDKSSWHNDAVVFVI